MQEENNTFIADDGKMFKRISDGVILGNRLTLGVGDSISNYEEVDESETSGNLHELEKTIDLMLGGSENEQA